MPLHMTMYFDMLIHLGPRASAKDLLMGFRQTGQLAPPLSFVHPLYVKLRVSQSTKSAYAILNIADLQRAEPAHA